MVKPANLLIAVLHAVMLAACAQPSDNPTQNEAADTPLPPTEQAPAGTGEADSGPTPIPLTILAPADARATVSALDNATRPPSRPTFDPTYITVTYPPFETPSSQAGTIVALLSITSAEVDVSEAQPVLKVQGFVPDSCTRVSHSEQERDEVEIKVTVYTERQGAAICAQVINEVQIEVPLEGSFPSGTYKVIVNEMVEVEFDVP